MEKEPIYIQPGLSTSRRPYGLVAHKKNLFRCTLSCDKSFLHRYNNLNSTILLNPTTRRYVNTI